MKFHPKSKVDTLGFPMFLMDNMAEFWMLKIFLSNFVKVFKDMKRGPLSILLPGGQLEAPWNNIKLHLGLHASMLI